MLSSTSICKVKQKFIRMIIDFFNVDFPESDYFVNKYCNFNLPAVTHDVPTPLNWSDTCNMGSPSSEHLLVENRNLVSEPEKYRNNLRVSVLMFSWQYFPSLQWLHLSFATIYYLSFHPIKTPNITFLVWFWFFTVAFILLYFQVGISDPHFQELNGSHRSGNYCFQ